MKRNQIHAVAVQIRKLFDKMRGYCAHVLSRLRKRYFWLQAADDLISESIS